MPSRMDRYVSTNEKVGTRTSKNEELYKDLYNNRKYTELKDIENNVMEIDNSEDTTSNKRRSDYKKVRMFNNNVNLEREEQIPYSSYQRILNEDNSEKNYNVNEVLDMAKKNRNIDDEIEKQRKIKSIEYSILSDLSQEKVKEYKAKKEKGITEEEAENLEELINTITSNSVRKKIDDELLGELMPDERNQTLVSDELFEELKAYDDDDKIDVDNTSENTVIDKSFYTRSMDLKKEDLIMDNSEDDEELDNLFKEEKNGTAKTVLIVLVVLVVMMIVGLLIYKYL